MDELVARAGYTGERRLRARVATGDAVRLSQALTEAGSDDLRPTGLSRAPRCA